MVILPVKTAPGRWRPAILIAPSGGDPGKHLNKPENETRRILLTGKDK
jgi:hypothetical protein